MIMVLLRWARLPQSTESTYSYVQLEMEIFKVFLGPTVRLEQDIYISLPAGFTRVAERH